jgi:cellulose synthase/poly-beta-1,6-N-acetylglucosamine synthase-like glycosyltransferase
MIIANTPSPSRGDIRHTIIVIIPLIFLIIVLTFQVFYIFNILVFCITRKELLKKNNFSKKELSIIIPLLNSEKTIGSCLDSILKNNLSLIDKVVVVLDHCIDGSNSKVLGLVDNFRESGTELIVITLPNGLSGKISAIKQGIKIIRTKNILLLDADIILEPGAIEELFNFHTKEENLCSSCLVYPFRINKGISLVQGIIHQDRLYRQNILKLVKSEYGLANFPGSIGVVNIENYKKFFKEGFLEDLSASFNIIGEGNRISILPEILAHEMERESILGVFLQRTRWSIGNIENIPLLFKTIFATKGLAKKSVVVSYPIMWYWQHYAIVAGVGMLIFFGQWQWLLPLLLYFIQIIISSWLGRKKYSFYFFEILVHCIIFPFIITTALFGAIWMVILNKKFYFKNNTLFNRI